jgi:hypothetical protein
VRAFVTFFEIGVFSFRDFLFPKNRAAEVAQACRVCGAPQVTQPMPEFDWPAGAKLALPR